MNDSHASALQDLIDYTRATANFADPAMKGLERSVERAEEYLQDFDDLVD